MRILGKTIVHSGPKYDYAVHRLQAAGGREIERGFIDHPGSVVLLPITAEGNVVMVRVFRHVLDRVLLELPAGTCHRGEPAEQTAVRELAEETGYRAARWERLFEMYPAPGAMNERMIYFRAWDLVPGPRDLEDDEEIEVEHVPLADALDKIARGEICDAKSIIGLWLQANYAKRSSMTRP